MNVSRETFPDLEKFRQIIIEKNKDINLISKQTEQISKERHIIDSAQIIDLIDLNRHICTDIGSGAGLPGIVLAIIMKHKKSNMEFHLYEKSYHKSNFLKDVSKRLVKLLFKLEMWKVHPVAKVKMIIHFAGKMFARILSPIFLKMVIRKV